MSHFPLNSLSIRRFWGKGERWKRKRERAEGEKRLTQMLLLEPSTPTQHDSLFFDVCHFLESAATNWTRCVKQGVKALGMSHFPLSSLSIRRFWGKGERWKRKRERAEEKRLTQMLLLEPSTPTQHDSIPSNQNHFRSLGCQLHVSKSSPKINLNLQRVPN